MRLHASVPPVSVTERPDDSYPPCARTARSSASSKGFTKTLLGAPDFGNQRRGFDRQPRAAAGDDEYPQVRLFLADIAKHAQSVAIRHPEIDDRGFEPAPAKKRQGRIAGLGHGDVMTAGGERKFEGNAHDLDIIRNKHPHQMVLPIRQGFARTGFCRNMRVVPRPVDDLACFERV